MEVSESEMIKKISNSSSGGVNLHPLSLVGIYFALLALIFMGLYWLNRNGKKTGSNTQETAMESSTRIQKTDQTHTAGSSAIKNTPTPTSSPDERKNPVNYFGPVGSLNHHYLQSAQFSKLLVEIDYVNSVPPDGSSVNALLSTIRQYADKPGGISRSGDTAIQSQKNTYTTQDLMDIAKANRSGYSQGDTVSLYILYMNGSLADNPNALGVALTSSMFVIFKDKINEATTAIIFASEIEKAVVIHELGHLWGLVNISYQSRIDHEDKQYPHHSKNKESVMYWAVEDVSVANLLRGGPPYQFDADDQSDINTIKL